MRPGPHGRGFVVRRGRPPRRKRPGTITLRDLGMTKQRLYRCRLLGQIPEAEFEMYNRVTPGRRTPTVGGALRQFGLERRRAEDRPECPTCGQPLPAKVMRAMIRLMEADGDAE
jgi:hypothetical protein